MGPSYRIGGVYFIHNINGSEGGIVLLIERILPTQPMRFIGRTLNLETGEMSHTGYVIENLPVETSLGKELSEKEKDHFKTMLKSQLDEFLCSYE